MNEIQPYFFNDKIKIIFILIIIFLVILVFYTEIVKNYKIKTTTNNFSIIKEELSREFSKCTNKESKLIFGGSCSQLPTTEMIANYFNNIRKIKNPFDNHKGVNGSAGSISLLNRGNNIILHVDTNANGGIDIEHIIYF